MAFARLVTHYVRHDAWLEDGSLLRGAAALTGMPGIMVHGRLDFQAPIAWAWDLGRVWPHAELVVVDNAGHAADDAEITAALIRSTEQFAGRR
jgi:proline iminopeptidase